MLKSFRDDRTYGYSPEVMVKRYLLTDRRTNRQM